MITTRHRNILLRMLREGVEAPPEFADQMGVSIATASAWLDELCAEGLAEREKQPTFRMRMKRVYLRYRLKEGSEVT